MEIFLIAFAMFSTAICRKPSATSSGVRVSPVSARMRSASSANLAATAPSSSGWSRFGPKTRGKNCGCTRPSMTLQSVTVSGPPLR